MVFSTEVLTKLQQDLEPSAVSKRSGGGGKELSYLSGHYVDSELIRIFGYGNFSTEVIQDPVEIRPGLFQAVVKTTILQDGVEVCSLTDVGYGTHNVMDTTRYKTVKDDSGKIVPVRDYDGNFIKEIDMKSVQEIEKAGKEAVTDARKRSLVSLGNRFGLCLYDKNDPIHNLAGGGSSRSSTRSSSAASSTSTSSSSASRTNTSRNPIPEDQWPAPTNGSGGWDCEVCGKPFTDSKSGWKAGELAAMSARSNDGHIVHIWCKDK